MLVSDVLEEDRKPAMTGSEGAPSGFACELDTGEMNRG